MQVEIKGLEELVKKLHHLGVNTQDVIYQGMHKGALKVQRDAKIACIHDTGRLKNSILVEKVDDKTIAVGTNVEYAVCVEFGTGTKGDKSVPHTTRKYWVYKGFDGKFRTSHGQAPKPFLRPSFQKNQNFIKKAVKLELMKALKERAGGT